MDNGIGLQQWYLLAFVVVGFVSLDWIAGLESLGVSFDALEFRIMHRTILYIAWSDFRSGLHQVF